MQPVATFSTIDSILIVLFFGAVVAVGFRSLRKRQATTVDFLLAGRTLTLPMFVATLVSTWYGGILGVGEYSYRFGISNWVVFGIPYYFFAVVFALFFAERIRRTNFTTIPDIIAHTFDKKTSLLGAVLTFLLVTPAPYVLMLGILVQLVFGIGLTESILISTLLTVCYLYWGGFRSDVYVNIVEFVLMFIGFAVILPFAYQRFGGMEFLRAHLPPLHLTWHGGNSLQFILVWFFIALWTLVDPAFYQRCYAARDGAVAKKGVLLSTAFWFLFDAMTSTAGLYARAVVPDLPQPAFAYPMLAEIVLPPFAKGMFYIGMFATIMSTLSSLTFIGATTIGNDMVGRMVSFGNSAVREQRVTQWTRIGLVVTAVVAVILALCIPSVVKLWYVIGTTIIPGLLLPVMAGYFRFLRVRPTIAFGAMIAGWGASTLWLVAGQLNNGVYWLGIEPMYPGMVLAGMVWGGGIAGHFVPSSDTRDHT